MIPAGVKIFLAATPIDFRKGPDSLLALVRDAGKSGPKISQVSRGQVGLVPGPGGNVQAQSADRKRRQETLVSGKTETKLISTAFCLEGY